MREIGGCNTYTSRRGERGRMLRVPSGTVPGISDTPLLLGLQLHAGGIRCDTGDPVEYGPSPDAGTVE